MPRKPKKRGPGRPSLGTDARSVNVTVKLTPIAANTWRAAASRESQSLSDWLRAAAEIALRREVF